MFATGLGTGYSPLTSGTVGSVPPLLIAYYFFGGDTLTLSIVAVVTTIASVYFADQAENLFGHDSKMITIDEFAGMFITVILVPVTWKNYLIAFIAFRVLDVVKIPPARQAERLPGGWGVTLDDVVAGIQACFVTHGIIWAANHYGWWA